MIGTASAFALQILSGQAITALGAKVNERIAAGQLWRLATPIFLHGGLPHLMVNMYSLNSIGPLMEATFGREQFLAVYFGAGVAGNYASYRFCASNSVGASGAVFGLAGALAVYLQRHKRYLGERADMQLQQLGTALAVNMGFGLTSRRIDNWGHAGGLVGGAALAFLTGPNLVMETDGGYGLRRKLVNKPKLQSTIRAIKDFWDEDDEDEDER
jgi:uridine nucleosidase